MLILIPKKERKLTQSYYNCKKTRSTYQSKKNEKEISTPVSFLQEPNLQEEQLKL